MSPEPVSKPNKSQKKALLIGINYEESEESDSLEGPHKGVMELRTLLIEQYDYASENVVVMRDSRQVPAELRPTYDNILKQIDVMVEGAQAGDHFFFAYSGHSGQVTNRRGSEVDGQDEVINTSDGKDLIDNELKIHLVDPLPLGSRLVAVMDTCHSGSLLDLKHHECNKVYSPRISKGCRRTDIRWNANVRQDDINSTAIRKLPRSCPCSQRQIVTTDRFWWHHNHDGMNYCETESRIRTSSVDAMVAPSPQPGNGIAITSRSWPLSVKTNEAASSYQLPMARCDSPTALWECEGDCRSKCTPTTEAAHVICISACKDEQRAWEGPTGASLTMEFVDILKENAHPSLKDLLKQLTDRTHERCLQIHECTRQFKRERRQESFWGEMDNFQDPQMASHVPLNMDEPFTL